MKHHQNRMAPMFAPLFANVAFVASRKYLAGLLLTTGLMLLSPLSQAATLTGDFNGDGRAGDVATIYEGHVVITHQGGAPATIYNIYTIPQFGNRLLSVSELNGRPGVEIAVIYDGVLVVVDDKRKTQRVNSIWTIGQFGPRVINFLNWDGVAGNEIRVNYYTTGLKVIYIDRTNSIVIR